MTPLPDLSRYVLGLLTPIMLIALEKSFRRHVARPNPLVTILWSWTALTGGLAIVGFFSDFTSMPPRIPVFIAVQSAFLIWLVFRSPWKDELTRIPQKTLIGLQAFRVPVEIALAALATERLLPVEMSYHGRNFDVLTGLTAIPMAWWVARNEARLRKLILAWNVAGLGLVTFVVGHGMLSAPYPFKVLHLSADNAVIGRFPAAWLPFVLVPCAYLLHLVSMRRAFSPQSRSRHAT